ncbi:sporulation protein YlmC with PRC-barrel domain [Paraburkholderia sp. GAS199]|uniref:PRC-barrel domain-containing protein n=1 Tax=Paraburkholderia sp. GAS199 TaxID=3035126 RepID=UPI003D1E00A9
MTTLDSDPTAMPGANIVGTGVGSGAGPGADVMAASSLDGNKVFSADGEPIGKIVDIMLDVRSGQVAYAVLSNGGVFGIGDTLHALPWSVLTLDTDDKCFILHVPAERLRSAPGFDKDHWPSMADLQWSTAVHAYYDRTPYWNATQDPAQTQTRTQKPAPDSAF